MGATKQQFAVDLASSAAHALVIWITMFLMNILLFAESMGASEVFLATIIGTMAGIREGRKLPVER